MNRCVQTSEHKVLRLMNNTVVISSSGFAPFFKKKKQTHSFSNNPPQTDPAPHLDDTPHPQLSVKAQLSSSGSSTCDKQQNSHANQHRKFSHCPRRARAVSWSSWSKSTTFISTDRGRTQSAQEQMIRSTRSVPILLP